ncbi:MAG: DUF6064 family protein [Bacteroidales bacterium]|jgi:hypothetical protein|nr:DUF6064 family protein [Bacteroidales bacterium]
MKTPFTTAQFFEIFEKYNSAVFPMQLIILALGIGSIILVHRNSSLKNSLIAGFLGLLWLWTGIFYHILFFTSINKAAFGFGGIFILQGIFFFIERSRKKLEFSFTGKVREAIGYFFILFGLIVYPLISYLLEDAFVNTISLGLPCPTTIFTFGFLMITTNKLSKYILIIPTLWAIIGTGAAINFGVYQDYVMLLSAIIAAVYLIKRKKEE